MVLYLLYFKAELENVGEVKLRTHGIHLRISVRNPQDGNETRDNVIVDPSEPLEPEGGESSSKEGPHHFRLKWEGSKKSSTLQVLSEAEAATALKKSKKKKNKGNKANDDGTPRSYTADDAGDWVPILAMECRGLEPYAFSPMKDEFVVMSEGGTIFDDDIELGDGDWAEYDAENDAPISMEDISFKFEAL
ncbi:unnamed protein product [Cylindrotheca closterium]|uniref:Uncharacterized protein n=1 Tax=Cylindrotheca closterium TaxID=2856 RepID=A0AAD2FN02_9STRA|nr:unnamed protein product [Cylindrotheca closterium]